MEEIKNVENFHITMAENGIEIQSKIRHGLSEDQIKILENNGLKLMFLYEYGCIEGK